jgi:hypothetical protein
MGDTRVVLDAFADARRTWDDLVGLQPDVYAGAGRLTASNLAELTRRVEAHQSAIDLLTDALETTRGDESQPPVAG